MPAAAPCQRQSPNQNHVDCRRPGSQKKASVRKPSAKPPAHQPPGAGTAAARQVPDAAAADGRCAAPRSIAALLPRGTPGTWCPAKSAGHFPFVPLLLFLSAVPADKARLRTAPAARQQILSWPKPPQTQHRKSSLPPGPPNLPAGRATGLPAPSLSAFPAAQCRPNGLDCDIFHKSPEPAAAEPDAGENTQQPLPINVQPFSPVSSGSSACRTWPFQ